MKFLSRSAEKPAGAGAGTRHESQKTLESERCPGVRYTILRVSFGRRTELIRKIRELARRAEYHAAGATAEDRIEAALLEREIERLYVEWGLKAVEGLEIDGEPATPEALAERGPENLFREISHAIRNECFLSQTERKN